ncbi:hypothetical protein AX774_g2464 [Zancudomyces culisetae]|uniref:Uncharacterized protein n=1 Tax=Zancudomyces culisetae TaxID=1213189 RepID=A0A1R1PSS3_ZANCU|nr:hypothetical protein AX774_g2464 [Zancudomyces culisetae]|eukprot:OMH84020.1 hypothetical protein AX774_g2464 [Zancudomyces culisetae]
MAGNKYVLLIDGENREEEEKASTNLLLDDEKDREEDIAPINTTRVKKLSSTKFSVSLLLLGAITTIILFFGLYPNFRRMSERSATRMEEYRNQWNKNFMEAGNDGHRYHEYYKEIMDVGNYFRIGEGHRDRHGHGHGHNGHHGHMHGHNPHNGHHNDHEDYENGKSYDHRFKKTIGEFFGKMGFGRCGERKWKSMFDFSDIIAARSMGDVASYKANMEMQNMKPGKEFTYEFSLKDHERVKMISKGAHFTSVYVGNTAGSKAIFKIQTYYSEETDLDKEEPIKSMVDFGKHNNTIYLFVNSDLGHKEEGAEMESGMETPSKQEYRHAKIQLMLPAGSQEDLKALTTFYTFGEYNLGISAMDLANPETFELYNVKSTPIHIPYLKAQSVLIQSGTGSITGAMLVENSADISSLYSSVNVSIEDPNGKLRLMAKSGMSDVDVLVRTNSKVGFSAKSNYGSTSVTDDTFGPDNLELKYNTVNTKLGYRKAESSSFFSFLEWHSSVVFAGSHKGKAAITFVSPFSGDISKMTIDLSKVSFDKERQFRKIDFAKHSGKKQAGPKPRPFFSNKLHLKPGWYNSESEEKLSDQKNPSENSNVGDVSIIKIDSIPGASRLFSAISVFVEDMRSSASSFAKGVLEGGGDGDDDNRYRITQ